MLSRLARLEYQYLVGKVPALLKPDVSLSWLSSMATKWPRGYLGRYVSIEKFAMDTI